MSFNVSLHSLLAHAYSFLYLLGYNIIYFMMCYLIELIFPHMVFHSNEI